VGVWLGEVLRWSYHPRLFERRVFVHERPLRSALLFGRDFCLTIRAIDNKCFLGHLDPRSYGNLHDCGVAG